MRNMALIKSINLIFVIFGALEGLKFNYVLPATNFERNGMATEDENSLDVTVTMDSVVNETIAVLAKENLTVSSFVPNTVDKPEKRKRLRTAKEKSKVHEWNIIRKIASAESLVQLKILTDKNHRPMVRLPTTLKSMKVSFSSTEMSTVTPVLPIPYSSYEKEPFKETMVRRLKDTTYSGRNARLAVSTRSTENSKVIFTCENCKGNPETSKSSTNSVFLLLLTTNSISDSQTNTGSTTETNHLSTTSSPDVKKLVPTEYSINFDLNNVTIATTARPLPSCCTRKYESCNNLCPENDCNASRRIHMAVCQEAEDNRPKSSLPNRLCAEIKPCILDVSHRIHSCIDKYLFGWSSKYVPIPWPWSKSHSITVCMDFPDKIWNIKQPVEITLKILFMAPISMLAVVFNGVVFRALIKHRHLQSPMNIFIGNVALADLLTAAFCPYLFLIEDLNQHYLLGNAGCKLQGFLQAMLLLVSVFSVVAVCAKRLIVVMGCGLTDVVSPLEKKKHTRKALAICFVTWITAATVAAPLPLGRYFVDRKWIDYEETFCGEIVWLTKYYWPYMVVILIWLPLCFLIVSYIAIFIKLDKYESNYRGRNNTTSMKRRRRLLAVMFSILLVFTICYSPLSLFIFFRVVILENFEEDHLAFDILWWVSHWLIYVNCVINPIIYGFTNDGIKEALKTLHSIRYIHRRIKIGAEGKAEDDGSVPGDGQSAKPPLSLEVLESLDRGPKLSKRDSSSQGITQESPPIYQIQTSSTMSSTIITPS